MNKKYALHLRMMQENSEERTKAIIEEKNEEIEKLLQKIEDLENENNFIQKDLEDRDRQI
jgi:hypothetical protein